MARNCCFNCKSGELCKTENDYVKSECKKDNTLHSPTDICKKWESKNEEHY